MFPPCSFDNILFKKIYLDQNSREIGNQLPQKISRVTKFMLDRGAFKTVKLTSSHYWRFPLFQGGLEARY